MDITGAFRVLTKGLSPPSYKTPKVQTACTGHMTTVYTDGSCTDGGYEEARARVGVWFGDGDGRNSVRVPVELPQTNNVAESLAVLLPGRKAPRDGNLIIKTDSQYVIDVLEKYREKIEDTDWLEQTNCAVLEPTIAEIRCRQGKTTLIKVKGHSGEIGNENTDRLAALGAEKEPGRPIDLSIDERVKVKGAKLSRMTQALLYKGIRRVKAQSVPPRRGMVAGLDAVRHAAHSERHQ
ncbi:ribonuclease H-like domain-containing protein [Ephemerocybe angulata]|uniref:ribonuclease H n=1 Tax=Ephemerocybe angulata TaxID=980116 RepID=A0A8H6LT16_9AGAR|nr:ribonuclease H-like domain-containing protein [Tulosesus angulatus]